MGTFPQPGIIAVTIETVGIFRTLGNDPVNLVGEGNHADGKLLQLAGRQVAAGVNK